MARYAVILALAVAGGIGAPAWIVLAGAAVLTLDDWRLWRLGRQTRIHWTSKARTYLVAGMLLDLSLAAVAFGVGRTARMLLGS